MGKKRQSWKFVFIFSSVFLHQKRDHQFLWTTYGGLSGAECWVSLAQKTGSHDLTACERHRNLLQNQCVRREGARGRWKGSPEEETCRVCDQCTNDNEKFSLTSKSNWIITSREFSISSLNKPVNPLGTDQRKKGLCKRTAWVLLDELHVMWWQRGYFY